MENQKIDEIIDYYNSDRENRFALESFLSQVEVFFSKNPALNQKPFPIIHSLKSRFKDPDHLRDKLNRKAEKGQVLGKECLFQVITDLMLESYIYIKTNSLIFTMK